MRILGLDPGVTTGWSLFHDEVKIAGGTIPSGLLGFIEWAKSEMPDHDVLVVENFVVERDFVGVAEASEIIGVAWVLSPAQSKHRQLRSAKSTLINGSEAKRVAWLRERGFNGVIHELDADTHILVYLKRIGHKGAFWRYWGKR